MTTDSPSLPSLAIDAQGMQAENNDESASATSLTAPADPVNTNMRTYTIFEVKKIIADLRRQQDRTNEQYEEERTRMKRALERCKGLISDHKKKDNSGVVDTLKGHIKELNQLRRADQRTINELRFALSNADRERKERDAETKNMFRRYDEELLRLKLKIRALKRSPSPHTSPIVTTTTTTTTTTIINDDKPSLRRVKFSPILCSIAPSPPRASVFSLSQRSPRMSSAPVPIYPSRSPKLSSAPSHPCVYPRSPRLVSSTSPKSATCSPPLPPMYPSRSPRLKSKGDPRRQSITMASNPPSAPIYYPPTFAFPVGVPIPLQIQHRNLGRSPKTPGSPSPANLEVLIL